MTSRLGEIIHSDKLKMICCFIHNRHILVFLFDDTMKIDVPSDKMAAILTDNIKCIFLNENGRIPIRISLKWFPRSQINNKPVLVQVMAWRRTCDKPLPELMLTQFIDAYMRH